MIGAQLMAVSGPIARSIADLRLSLHAMAAPDLRDPWYMPVPLQGPQTARKAALCLEPEGMHTAPEIKTALREAAQKLADAGWHVEEIATPPLREAVALQLRLWLAEMRRTGGAAIYAEQDPDAIFVYENLGRHAPDTDLNAFMDTFQSRSRLVRAWRAFFQDWPVLLCPVSGELPFADHRDVASEADFDAVIEAQTPQIGLPLMGLPGLTVTTGLIGSTPVGVQVVADQFREDLLLEVGDIIAKTIPAIA
jgi:amidase